MGWLQNLFGREPKPDHPLPITEFDRTQGGVHGLRRGMWVVLRGPSHKPGILTALSPEGMARVMLVHPVAGTNEVELDMPASSIRQAKHKEIPQDRRPSKSEAISLGYGAE